MRVRGLDNTFKQMQRLSRRGKATAALFGHDMGRYDRSPDYGHSSASPVHYNAIASCRRCCAQVRVSTAAVVTLEGDALGPLTCQQVQMKQEAGT